MDVAVIGGGRGTRTRTREVGYGDGVFRPGHLQKASKGRSGGAEPAIHDRLDPTSVAAAPMAINPTTAATAP